MHMSMRRYMYGHMYMHMSMRMYMSGHMERERRGVCSPQGDVRAVPPHEGPLRALFRPSPRRLGDVLKAKNIIKDQGNSSKQSSSSKINFGWILE